MLLQTWDFSANGTILSELTVFSAESANFVNPQDQFQLQSLYNIHSNKVLGSANFTAKFTTLRQCSASKKSPMTVLLHQILNGLFSLKHFVTRLIKHSIDHHPPTFERVLVLGLAEGAYLIIKIIDWTILEKNLNWKKIN